MAVLQHYNWLETEMTEIKYFNGTTDCMSYNLGTNLRHQNLS